MSEAFAHLRVASSFSLRYGVSTPEHLVETAARWGQPILALTDRDGLYGAVRFVRAAHEAGIDPVVGVDLAVEEPLDPLPGGVSPLAKSRPRKPVRGGVWRDLRHPRVVVLARGHTSVLAGTGWSQLCRLVTAAHARGARGTPTVCAATVGEVLAAEQRSVTVMFGVDSPVGVAVRRGQRRAALEQIAHWRRFVPAEAMVVATTWQRGPSGTSADRTHARRMIELADEVGLPCVLTATVRHAQDADVTTADLIDAIRRQALMSDTVIDRQGAPGTLSATAHMREIGAALCDDPRRAELLWRQTIEVAHRHVLHPLRDVGIGTVRVPEPEVLGTGDALRDLTLRCRAAVPVRYPAVSRRRRDEIDSRLDHELDIIASSGLAAYFLGVAAVTDVVKEEGVRVAARGSGAGSLVNHLLGISAVDPLSQGLLMERFCTPLRSEIPDIDIDVESDRRTDMYRRIIRRFGERRVACVSMMETYRVRQAVRDVGAALGLCPSDVGAIAGLFPHLRAADAQEAIDRLPELKSSGLDTPQMKTFFSLVARLDGLPRHLALHPCGVILSDLSLLDRTPIQQSGEGFATSHFDKDDVEAMGFVKLDVLGVRMQSSLAHSLSEIARTGGGAIDLDAVPLDDAPTYGLIGSTRTLGCFQIESPGQRELVGKFEPTTFDDLVVDISLFRPGPVKSDMITPFLAARHGWAAPDVLHPTLAWILDETAGVVVFHEQVLRILAVTAGISLALADEVRRALGRHEARSRIGSWWLARAAARGYAPAERTRIWDVLEAFGSFGFCKAHAAAFALPTYHSSWLKTHHPAAFYAGILTHDPGMYPKRLILDDARQFGVPVFGLDIDSSDRVHRVVDDAGQPALRLALSDVKGITDDEMQQIIHGRPYGTLEDFWRRTRVRRPVVDHLIYAGAFDRLHGIDSGRTGRRGQTTRRDLLLTVDHLAAWVPRAADDTAGPTQPRLDFPFGVPTAHGLSEMGPADRVRAELDVLGLDVTDHVLRPLLPCLRDLQTVSARNVRDLGTRQEVLVAGVKVATQTPPIRSGARVVFLTLEDTTGPIDITLFEDAQAPYAQTIFHAWTLLVRGKTRRTGRRGMSIRATAVWDLSTIWAQWRKDPDAARRALDNPGSPITGRPPLSRRVEVYAGGFTKSMFTDIATPGADLSRPGRALADLSAATDLPQRKLWHTSPGSPGR